MKYLKLIYYEDRGMLGKDKSSKKVKHGHSFIYDDINLLINGIGADLDAHDPGDDVAYYRLTTIELTEKEFESLPDFPGY